MFMHISAASNFTASAVCDDERKAFYAPGERWHFFMQEHQRAAIAADLAALKVDLEHKDPEDHIPDFERILARDTRAEVSDLVGLADLWSNGHTDIAARLRAHIAAVAAVTATGAEQDEKLYTAVYDLTFARVSA